ACVCCCCGCCCASCARIGDEKTASAASEASATTHEHSLDGRNLDMEPSSDRYRFPVCCSPSPCARSVAALQHTFPVDLGNDLAVAGEKRFRRAHFRAERQLAFCKSVGPVRYVFRFREVDSGAAGAIR